MFLRKFKIATELCLGTTKFSEELLHKLAGRGFDSRWRHLEILTDLILPST